MLFQRKIFVDVIKSMTPYDGKLYFRDSKEKGMFEVICLKKSKFSVDRILLKAVFQSEDANIFSEDVGAIGEPFYVDAQNVLAALAGKEPLAEYKDGLFDGVSVGKYSPAPDGDFSYGMSFIRDLLSYHDAQIKPEFTLTIPAGKHRIITRNIKSFPSTESDRASLNTICLHFKEEGDFRIAATDGRSLAVYYIPEKFDAALLGTWTLSPEMLMIPPYNYESVTFAISKEVVSMSIRGQSDSHPAITAYDVPMEWKDLKHLRKDMKLSLEKGQKTQEEVDEEIKTCIDQGPSASFVNYERVIPESIPEKIILDREEVTTGLEKLKRFLYKSFYQNTKSFVIDALDPKNITLTSMRELSDYGISYIDTILPLKKVEVSRPVRAILTVDSFEKCFLEGSDRIELRFKNAKKVYVAEGVDFYKGHSVKVKKIFTAFTIPKTFDDFGVAPVHAEESTEDTTEESED